MQVWDIRTGGAVETHRFEAAVTDLAFDSRKVLACVGDSSLEVRITVVAYFTLRAPLLVLIV